MDQRSRAHIEEIEKNSRFPTGIGKIERRECPRGFHTPIACMFCPNGHMLECHFPYTCEEVECSHYQEEMKSKTMNLFRQAKQHLDKKDNGDELTEEELGLVNTAESFAINLLPKLEPKYDKLPVSEGLGELAKIVEETHEKDRPAKSYLGGTGI